VSDEETNWNEAAVSNEVANDIAQARIADIIQAVYPGDVPLKFLILTEVLDKNTGKRSMVYFKPNDVRPWDTLGMVEWLRILVDDAMTSPSQ
jgi:hypothetical protein